VTDRSDGITNKVPGREAMERPLPRRFYARAEAGQHDQGFVVLLDSRPARTPSKKLLAVPAHPLAAALAEEWANQADKIDPATMPLTRLVNTIVDGVSAHAEAVRTEIVKYAGSDLVCYRADFPAELMKRQAAAWDPVLDWAHRALGTRFFLAEGVMPVAQLPETLDRVARHVDRLDPFRLGSVHVMMTLTGSALLALAVQHGSIDAESAWVRAHVDEDFQIEQWGEDAEASERRSRRKAEMDAAARLLTLLERPTT
jgi:chaperone required for assembly of F1-ATPase